MANSRPEVYTRPQNDLPSPAAREADRQRLERDVEAFLAAGGKINQHGIRPSEFPIPFTLHAKQEAHPVKTPPAPKQPAGPRLRNCLHCRTILELTEDNFRLNVTSGCLSRICIKCLDAPAPEPLKPTSANCEPWKPGEPIVPGDALMAAIKDGFRVQGTTWRAWCATNKLHDSNASYLIRGKRQSPTAALMITRAMIAAGLITDPETLEQDPAATPSPLDAAMARIRPLLAIKPKIAKANQCIVFREDLALLVAELDQLRRMPEVQP